MILKENFVVRTPTWKEFKRVCDVAHKLGYKWNSGNRKNERIIWDDYSNITAILFYSDGTLEYAYEEFYVDEADRYSIKEFFVADYFLEKYDPVDLAKLLHDLDEKILIMERRTSDV